MTNAQLYFAIGVPTGLFTLLFVIFFAHMNARFTSLVAVMNARFDAVATGFKAVDTRFDAVEARFKGIDAGFAAVNQRFDDMRELWKSELYRVEGTFDARLKVIEQERR